MGFLAGIQPPFRHRRQQDKGAVLHKRIRFEQPVYSFNIDSNRHVSNLIYVEWMEIARIRLLEAVGLPLAELEKRGFAPVLRSTSIDYKKPLLLGDRVETELWISRLSRIAATMQIRFYRDDGQLVASGSQKGLFVSLKTERPYRLSPRELALFEPYVIETAAAGGEARATA